MSDVERSSGKSATKGAAPVRQTWETRLEAARKQRAIALERSARKDSDPRPENPANVTPVSSDDSTLEKVVARQTRSDLATTGAQPGMRRRGIPLAVAAAVSAAVLVWIASQRGPAFSGLSGILSDGPRLQSPAFGLKAYEPIWDAGVRVADQMPAPIIFYGTPSAYRPLEPQTEWPYAPDATAFDPSEPHDTVDVPSTAPPFVGGAPEFAGPAANFDGSALGQVTPTPVALNDDARPIVASDQAPLAKWVPVSPPEPVLADSLPTGPVQDLSGRIEAVEDLLAESPTDANLVPSLTADVSLFVPNQVSEGTGARALALLSSGRANVVDTARVDYSVRNTQVRFYHAQDAAVSGLAAEALGGTSRDFTNSNSKTRPGHIEVYLAGSGQRATRSDTETPTGFERFLARLLKAAN